MVVNICLKPTSSLFISCFIKSSTVVTAQASSRSRSVLRLLHLDFREFLKGRSFWGHMAYTVSHDSSHDLLIVSHDNSHDLFNVTWQLTWSPHCVTWPITQSHYVTWPITWSHCVTWLLTWSFQCHMTAHMILTTPPGTWNFLESSEPQSRYLRRQNPRNWRAPSASTSPPCTAQCVNS